MPPPAPPPAAPPAPAAPPPSAPPSAGAAPPAPPKSASDGLDSSWMDAVAHDLDELDDSTPKPSPKPPKPAPATKPPKGEPKPPKSEPKTPSDETKPPVSETPPAGEPVKAADLRNAFQALKKEKAEVLQPKIQQLESRLKELESRGPEEVKALQDKLASIEKRNAELESEIEFASFTKSKPYDEVHKPYVEAWARAVRDITQLTVKRETAEGTQSTPATADDLLYLANIPLSELDAKAEEMFGKAAARVVRHVERVRELAEAENRAIADAHKRSGERQKTREIETRQSRERETSLFKQFNAELHERFPNMFGEEEGDTEGNASLKKGFEQADRLFMPTEQNAFKSREEEIQFHALIRNKIANHDRLALRVKRLNSEVAELKKSLEAYEASEPKGGIKGGGKTDEKTWLQQVDDEIAALDKP